MGTQQISRPSAAVFAWALVVLGLVATPLWYLRSLSGRTLALASAESADDFAVVAQEVIARFGDEGRRVVEGFVDGDESMVYFAENDELVIYDPRHHALRIQAMTATPGTWTSTGDPGLEAELSRVTTLANASTFERWPLDFAPADYLGLEVVDDPWGPMVVVKARNADTLVGVIYRRADGNLTREGARVDVEPDTLRMRRAGASGD